MNKYILLIPFLFIWINSTFGQPGLKSYIQENTVKINSVNPDDADYSDLELIGKAIGNAQIVMLGEQDHGDAPTFQAKARIIKYLHEKKGFNVIAFESDFYALNQGWNQVLSNKLSSDSLIQQNIFQVWTQCKECDDVLSYINSSQKLRNRIHITGFDLQIHGLYSRKQLKKELNQYLNSKKVQFLQTPAYKNLFLSALDSIMLYTNKPGVLIHDQTFNQTIKFPNIILAQLKVENKEDAFWRTTIESIRAQTESMFYIKYRNSKTFSLRDEQMAKNLHWLANNTYKN